MSVSIIWQLVYSESYKGDYTGSRLAETVLFQTDGEMSLEEFMGNRKQHLENNGVIILHADIWKPLGKLRSNLWLIQVVLGLDPGVYPESEGNPQLTSQIIRSITSAAKGGGVVVQKIFEDISNTINQVIGVIVIMMVMMTMMPIFMTMYDD